MIIGEEWFMIRELKRQGLSISEISKRTGRDRKTIRKIINQKEMPTIKKRPQGPSKLDPYMEYLQKRMDIGVYNCVKLLREIKDKGYTGGITILKDFVRPFRQREQAIMRYETPPGYQAQVDWGTVGKIYRRGVLKTVYCFCMTLGYSRAMYVEFTTRADTRAFIRGHINAFNYFGGITETILYDNTKCAKLAFEDGLTVLNPTFADFAATYSFTPKFCRPYRPQTKGYVSYCTSCVLYSFSLPRLAIFFLISITASSLGRS